MTSFAADQQYPFNFALWDDDRFTYPGQTHLFWQSTTTNAYKSDWGMLQLGSTVYDFSQATAVPGASPTPTRTPSMTPTRTQTPTVSVTPTQTLTPSASSSATPTPTGIGSPTPTATATPIPKNIGVLNAGLLPVIDGDLAEWGALTSTRLNAGAGYHNYVTGVMPTLADLSAELRSAWAPDMLYFAASVQDDVLVGNNSTQIWGDDVIELAIRVPQTSQTHQFILALDGRMIDNGIPISSLTVVTRTIPGGWALEAAIPPSALGLTSFAADQQYPFNFALWDDDLFTYPGQTHLFWQSTTTNTYKSDWGMLQLDSTTSTTSRRQAPRWRRPRVRRQRRHH